MLVDATLLIQDVQLLCFTIVFGVLALQRWNDRTRRWLWFGFLANAAGAIFDLLAGHLPAWIGHGINLAMIPLSYALLNVALVHFERRSRKSIHLSAAILLCALPWLLAWCHDPSQVRSYGLADLAIALEVLITFALLLHGKERATRAPRMLMGGFLMLFAIVELARAGVTFLLHADPDVLSRRLELVSAIAYIIDTSLLPLAFVWMMNARLESELLKQAQVDPLTHVLNRRGLETVLERELARYRRYGHNLTVAILDLDHFKRFNDLHGHAAGDAVLTAVAALLRNALRETDAVGRFGGEEFVLILPHTNIAESTAILEQLCISIRERSFAPPHPGVRATASFGASNSQTRSAISASELLHEADVALYRAKEEGRDRVHVFVAAPTPAVATTPLAASLEFSVASASPSGDPSHATASLAPL